MRLQGPTPRPSHRGAHGQFVALSPGLPGLRRPPARHHPGLRRLNATASLRRSARARPSAWGRDLAAWLGCAPSRRRRWKAPASRHHEAREHPAHTPDPRRPSRLAVALGERDSCMGVAVATIGPPQEQGHRRARRQARPDRRAVLRSGEPTPRRDGRQRLNQIDRCGSQAAAVSDVCGRCREMAGQWSIRHPGTLV